MEEHSNERRGVSDLIRRSEAAWAQHNERKRAIFTRSSALSVGLIAGLRRLCDIADCGMSVNVTDDDLDMMESALDRLK